jgi:type I restriction enzyme, S subunit
VSFCVAQRLPFERVLEDVSAGNSKVQKVDYLSVGRYPIIDQGQNFVGGFSDDKSNLVSGQGPWIVFGDHTRIIKYVDFPFCMGADGVKVLRPRSGLSVDAKYLFHFLNAHEVPSAGYSRHYKFLKRLEVPLPALDEQLRIAAILDRADALRRRRNRAIGLLDSLTLSIFLEQFGDLVDSRKYPRGTISDWVEDFETGKNLAPDPDALAAGGYRVLKVSAVTTGVFLPNESKPLPEDYEPPAAHVVCAGDLLFSRANTAELIGATAYVESECEHIVLPDKIWRFRWRKDNAPNPRFVHALFSSPTFRREVSKRATGTSGSMKNISKEKVLGIKVALPSRDEQDEFASKQEALRTVKESAMCQARLIEEQFSSLQHRAFSGQL